MECTHFQVVEVNRIIAQSRIWRDKFWVTLNGFVGFYPSPINPQQQVSSEKRCILNEKQAQKPVWMV
jgi:hypothetical protein